MLLPRKIICNLRLRLDNREPGEYALTMYTVILLDGRRIRGNAAWLCAMAKLRDLRYTGDLTFRETI